MTMKVGVGGVWKTVASIKVGVGGVWKTVSQISAGVGGAWKTAFAAINFQNTSVSDFELQPTDGVASITFTSGGVVNEVGNTGGASPAFTWLVAGNASDYDIRFILSGDTGSLSGSALNTWLNLGTSRGVTLSTSSSFGKSVSGTYEIGLTGTATALGSASMSLSAVSDV